MNVNFKMIMDALLIMLWIIVMALGCHVDFWLIFMTFMFWMAPYDGRQ